MTRLPTLSFDCPPATLVGYHGTNVEFDAFDLARAGSNFGNAISREGIFFSAEAYVAESVADQVVEEFGGIRRVIQASLRMERGLRLDMGGRQDAGEVLRTLTQAKAGGHDGLIIENWDDGLCAQHETQYVVFHPAQIKILNPEKNELGKMKMTAGRRRKP